MRLNFAFFLLSAFLIVLSHAQSTLAGNKWMMEKNGNELIMLNSTLLNHLGTNIKDGKITLSGDVVHEDGKVIIKLYKLQQIQTTPDAEAFPAEVFDKDQSYHIFMREETLSEIPAPNQENSE